jgi:ferredoxin
MRIIVDLDLCEGHAQCCSLAPQVFQLDADYVMHVLVDEVPAAQRAAVREAVECCPRQALRTEDGEARL